MGFTPEGEMIVNFAKRVVAEHEALAQSVSTVREGVSGRLRIGAIPTTLSSISLLTEPFSQKHPLATLSITAMSATEIQRGLTDFDIDVGLTYTDNEPLKDVRKTPLYRENYVLLTDADGRFADRESVTWEEAAEVPLCLLSSDIQNRRIVNEAFRRLGREPFTTLETNSIAALFSHVRAGGGSAVMSHTWLHLYPVPEDMRAFKLVTPEISKEVGLVVADQGPEPILALALLETAEDVDMARRLNLESLGVG